jgi:hypothetical protein
MAVEIQETIDKNLNEYNPGSYEDEADIDSKEILLTVSKQQLKVIEAGAFYNNYSSLEEFILDTVINEVETDKQRYSKAKESNKVKK